MNQLGGVVAEAVQALTSPKSGMEAQTKAAKAIIAAGKKNNVAELEIVMAEEAGLSLGSRVNGVPIKAIAGKSNTLTIKVIYKQ
jgi:hypothetical protein